MGSLRSRPGRGSSRSRRTKPSTGRRIVAMSANNDPDDRATETTSDISRREVLLTLGGVAAAVGAGAATWGGLELLVNRKQTVDTWTKSVCRFCGTGCGVRVGMNDGRVADVRGDELAHNKGVICVKGSMLPELTRIPGRLTTPKIRKDGQLVDASWDEAMGLVGARFSGEHSPVRPRLGRLLRFGAALHRGILHRQQAVQGRHRHQQRRRQPAAVHGVRGRRLHRRPTARTSRRAAMTMPTTPTSSS